MTRRERFGIVCAMALAVLLGTIAALVLWYLLTTSPPLGIGLFVCILLLAGATWGMS